MAIYPRLGSLGVLMLMIGVVALDYPPHDLYYRIHHPELYPEERSFYECMGRRSWLRCVMSLSSDQMDNVLTGLGAVYEEQRVPEADACRAKVNGQYHHSNPALGNPRCSYVVCFNGKTVVQNCPLGTRTGDGSGLDVSTKSKLLAQRQGARKYSNYYTPPGTYGQNQGRSGRAQLRVLDASHGICSYHDYEGICTPSYPWGNGK